MVDTSLFETGLGWMAQHLAGYIESGRQPPRHRSGNPKLIVFQAFDTADGEIVVAAANDRLFAKFAAVLGHPEWGSDPRFRTNADRIAHRDILLPLLEAVMRTPQQRGLERGAGSRGHPLFADQRPGRGGGASADPRRSASCSRCRAMR